MSLVVNAAASQAGYRENGKNKNKFGKLFGMNGVAWCGIFVWWCYLQAYGINLKKYGPIADCTGFYQAAKKLGWVVSSSQVISGSIVIFNFPGGDAEDHMGVFVKWVGPDHFLSWEGNTGANNTNGGQVMLRTRHKSLVRAFINPPFNNPHTVTQPPQVIATPELNPTPAAVDFLNGIKFALDTTKSKLTLKTGDGTVLSAPGRGLHDAPTRLAVRTMQHGINTSSNRKDKPGLWNGNQLLLLLEDGCFTTQTQLHLRFWQGEVAGLLPDGEFGPASYQRMFGG